VRTWALIVDTWREALARYTLLGFAVVSALFLLTLTFALNLDIVDGSLAAGTLFGKAFELHHGARAIDTVVVTGQSVFAAMLYILGVFLAVFATGSQVPNLQRRGTVDLYMTRPITRTHLLLGRYLGAATLVTVNLLLLCGGVFVIISLKTKVWNPRFILATGLILVVFLSYLGFMYLVGVLSSSTPLSIMLPYALYMISLPLAAHDRIAAAMAKANQPQQHRGRQLKPPILLYPVGEFAGQRHVPAHPQMPFTKFARICGPWGVWVTSGWNWRP
jgi:ABC-2 type transport system permease protein